MEIVWDEPKRLANIGKHGFDFALLPEGFFLKAKVLPTRQGRYVAIGRLESRAVIVIFQPMGEEALAVISMRPASAKERALIP